MSVVECASSSDPSVPLIIKKLINVQVSELTEKFRTDSTGRLGDPDFKFLKNAKMQSTAKQIVCGNFAIRGIRSSFENQKCCCR